MDGGHGVFCVLFTMSLGAVSSGTELVLNGDFSQHLNYWTVANGNCFKFSSSMDASCATIVVRANGDHHLELYDSSMGYDGWVFQQIHFPSNALRITLSLTVWDVSGSPREPNPTTPRMAITFVELKHQNQTILDAFIPYVQPQNKSYDLTYLKGTTQQFVLSGDEVAVDNVSIVAQERGQEQAPGLSLFSRMVLLCLGVMAVVIVLAWRFLPR